MTGEIKGYLLDYGGTLDTAGCHWGKFIWHGYERCRVGVAWDDFREAYVIRSVPWARAGSSSRP